MKALKEEKNIESKQFLEAIAVMSVLSEAKCSNLPAFLEIDLNLSALKSRDKYIGLLAAEIESFAQNYQQNTNDKAIVAVLATEEQPLKRSRRATEEVNMSFVV